LRHQTVMHSALSTIRRSRPVLGWTTVFRRGVESLSDRLSQIDTIPIDKEPYCRQRSELPIGDRLPMVAPDAFVSPSAVLIGSVNLYNKVPTLHLALFPPSPGLSLGRMCPQGRPQPNKSLSL